MSRLHVVARGSSGESVLLRATRVLEAFTTEDTTLRISEIARRSGLPLATASRLVAELVDLGLLTRADDRRVGIGLRLWELASRASPALSLRDAAMPFMEDLHAVVGHHIQLGVLDGSEVLFLERLSTTTAVVNITRIAGRLPLHASSAGLVLLAHGPSDLVEATVTGPLARYTRHTITSPAALRRVLAGIRRDGFVVCPGHIDLDATGIAVPVRDAAGAVVAALAVIVPNDHAAGAQVPALRAAARGMSRRLATPTAGQVANSPPVQ